MIVLLLLPVELRIQVVDGGTADIDTAAVDAVNDNPDVKAIELPELGDSEPVREGLIILLILFLLSNRLFGWQSLVVDAVVVVDGVKLLLLPVIFVDKLLLEFISGCTTALATLP